MGKYVVRFKAAKVKGMMKGKMPMMNDDLGDAEDMADQGADEGQEEQPKPKSKKPFRPEKQIVENMVGKPKKGKKEADLETGEKGSAKSGNYGHRGIQGHQGGSAPKDSGASGGGGAARTADQAKADYIKAHPESVAAHQAAGKFRGSKLPGAPAAKPAAVPTKSNGQHDVMKFNGKFPGAEVGKVHVTNQTAQGPNGVSGRFTTINSDSHSLDLGAETVDKLLTLKHGESIKVNVGKASTWDATRKTDSIVFQPGTPGYKPISVWVLAKSLEPGSTKGG